LCSRSLRKRCPPTFPGIICAQQCCCTDSSECSTLLAATLLFRLDRGSEIASLVAGLALLLWVGVQQLLVHSLTP